MKKVIDKEQLDWQRQCIREDWINEDSNRTYAIKTTNRDVQKRTQRRNSRVKAALGN